MTRNSSHDHIHTPQSQDVRVSGLIVRPDAAVPSYEERNPLLHGGATPLDPNLLQYGDKPYEAYCIDANNALVKELTDKYGLTEGQAKRLSMELNAELTVRCGHNDDAMLTLRESLDKSPVGDEALAIIEKARESGASPAELRELLDQFPEIIAVGVTDFLKPFDPRAHALAVAINGRIARTLFGKATSELTGLEFVQDTGSLIVKRVIGRDSESTTPRTPAQMRMKQIFFATPKPGRPELKDMRVSELSRKDILWRVLATESYLCVDGYKERTNYRHERDTLHMGRQEIIALSGMARMFEE